MSKIEERILRQQLSKSKDQDREHSIKVSLINKYGNGDIDELHSINHDWSKWSNGDIDKLHSVGWGYLANGRFAILANHYSN